MIFGKDKEKMSKLEHELAEAKREINKLKNTEPQKSLEYVKEAISKIRHLDLTTKDYILYEKDWNEKYVNNNIIEYALLLRTELNLLYCLFSKNNIDNQINNIHKICRFKEDVGTNAKETLDKIKLLDEKKEESILPNLEEDKRAKEFSIIHKLYNSYNRNLINFPNNFFYGIEEDKKF